MNIVALIKQTADDLSWNWQFCCVCGDKPTDFGLYLTGTAAIDGPDATSCVVRVAWCDDKTCVEDRLGTPHIAISDELAAA